MGLDNVGKINADTTRNYYLKDHLGSVRVVLNSTNTVISANDYDCWGYLLEGRTYESVSSVNQRYKFTGKERDRDLESNYDYFGARYYDSRIANWTSIDPLFEKHFDYSPYNYVLRNPLVLIDPDGKQVDIKELSDPIYHINKEVGFIYDYAISVNNKLAEQSKKLNNTAKEWIPKFAFRKGVEIAMEFVALKLQMEAKFMIKITGVVLQLALDTRELGPKSEQDKMDEINEEVYGKKKRIDENNDKKEEKKEEKKQESKNTEYNKIKLIPFKIFGF